MLKIGAVGELETVELFKAMGIWAFQTGDYREAHRWIMQMAQDGFGIIFLSESLAKEMDETIAAFKDQVVPVIVLIPNFMGTDGSGLEVIKQNVVKAVGMDIFTGKEGD